MLLLEHPSDGTHHVCWRGEAVIVQIMDMELDGDEFQHAVIRYDYSDRLPGKLYDLLVHCILLKNGDVTVDERHASSDLEISDKVAWI